jgi:hypothetical protein
MGSSSGRWGCIAALCAACAWSSAVAQQAGTAQQMRVSAQVQEHAQIRVVSQPAFFDVSESDIARGYVEVGTPLRIEVVSNLQRGVSISFSSFDRQVREARAALERQVAPRVAGLQRELVEVHLRLELAEGARAGRHAWPVQVSMAPL